ncbi:MAG: zinc metallopeptidase [Chloroflexi bacterium HGW-Chloroflexi-10]|nr:MAG: zinc metallopeptidase [Chloroflexi bacterium HGW-Chloroflexi-10]
MGFGFGGYGIYLLFSLPALLLGFWAQIKVKSALAKYSKIRSNTGFSGADVARKMLDSNGLYDVKVEETSGFMGDHYDPRSKTLRLSPAIYRTPSIAAAGVAAHEAGHALQDHTDYVPLRLRTAMVPTVQFGSWLGPIIFIGGLVLNFQGLAWAGLILFAATALFALVTLPVEFNATNRAKAWLTTSGIIYQQESQGINKVLDAAALTYVAAAIQAISTLLYYAFLLLGSRDR